MNAHQRRKARRKPFHADLSDMRLGETRTYRKTHRGWEIENVRSIRSNATPQSPGRTWAAVCTAPGVVTII